MTADNIGETTSKYGAMKPHDRGLILYPHKTERRSVEHDALDKWVGWEHIMRLYNKALSMDALDGRKRALYFVTIFQTGGRVSEVCKILNRNIEYDDNKIVVNLMDVLKRRRRFTRSAIIKREGNQLADEFIRHFEESKAHGNVYLLSGSTRGRYTVNAPDKPASRRVIYGDITSIDDTIWPHWIRDARSWHLGAKVEQGGRGFDAFLLKTYFGWARMDMAAHYAGRRDEDDIMDAFGIPRGTN